VTTLTATSSTGSVTSRDGTTIGYRRLGSGPGVVILHGAMEHGGSHAQLAAALADTFTVYLPDRRGRGLSGPYQPDHRIQTDVDDMDAVLTQTGAHNVFGVSSGALIWLHAARTLAAIHRAVIFEPPLLVDARSVALMKRFDDEIARGRLSAALVSGMQAGRFAPPLLDLIPRFLLERMTQAMLAAEDRKASPGDVTVRTLAPALHYDFQLVADSQGMFERFGETRADVLLMRGSKSPAYLRSSVEALRPIFPRAELVELTGLGHSASGNSDDPMTGKGADPERVARELRRFFA
jgi:pimeloyl-ACP methyl ester carboxylesterase